MINSDMSVLSDPTACRFCCLSTPKYLLGVIRIPVTRGTDGRCPKISVKAHIRDAEKRQPPIPETARTAGGCDCPDTEKRQGFLLLLLSSFESGPNPPRRPQVGQGLLCPEGGHTAPHSRAHGHFMLSGEAAAVDSNDPSPSVLAGWCRGYYRSTSYPACQCRLCFDCDELLVRQLRDVLHHSEHGKLYRI